MSYYYKNQTSDVYKINKVLTSDEFIEMELIEICNNEPFTLDMSDFMFYGNVNQLTNSEIMLIIIDWGDGEKDRLGKGIIKIEDKISSFEQNEWKIITHEYNKKEYDDSFIKIKIYNTAGDSCIIKIPYKIINKSLYDIATNFKLLSSNKSNKNVSQFVLKEGLKDSIIIV